MKINSCIKDSNIKIFSQKRNYPIFERILYYLEEKNFIKKSQNHTLIYVEKLLSLTQLTLLLKLSWPHLRKTYQAEVNRLINSMTMGNINPATGTKNLFKNVCYPRIPNGLEKYDVDVFIQLQDGETYTVIVRTAKNLEYLTEKGKIDLLLLHQPFVAVRKLTRKIIEGAVEIYVEDGGYWLKFYHLAKKICISFMRLKLKQ